MTKMLPMLASAMTTRIAESSSLAAIFPPAEFVAEEKLDGHRMLVAKCGETVIGWFRPADGRREPEIGHVPAKVKAACLMLPDGVYDGELTIPGGTSSDVWRARARRSRDVEPFVYVVFDVLDVLGNDVTKMQLRDRRAMLAMCVAHAVGVHAESIQLARQFPPSWDAFKSIRAAGGEGLVIKRLSSRYRRDYRSPDWVKVVEFGAASMTVTGFIPGASGPFSSVSLRGPVDVASVKTVNSEWLRRFAENPDLFIGRQLVIKYTDRAGKPMHPRWDHFEG